MFKDINMIPVYMMFVGIWLIKFYSDKLKNVIDLNKYNKF